MAQLTREQVEAAVDVVIRSYGQSPSQYGVNERNGVRQSVLAVAPYLQMPWDRPIDEEVCEFGAKARCRGVQISNAQVGVLLLDFITKRNAAIFPKPVDPRRKVVLRVLAQTEARTHDQLEDRVTKILAALDEVE